MASPSSFSIIFFFLLFPMATSQLQDRLPATEQEAAYRVLESVDPTIPWRSLYPDDLCFYGPHGLLCEPDLVYSTPHIVELNLGFVSDFSANPTCSPNATLPPPSALSSFPYLRKLFFFGCFYSPDDPVVVAGDFWAALPSSLEELVFLSNPFLSGRLTSHISNLARLRRLVISGAAVSGPIPAEIADLRRLEQLVLSGNRLHGPIPTAIGWLDRLKILDLSGNLIAGGIPSEMGRLVELVKLDLSSNRLAGPIPASLGSLLRLELLDLSFNRLTGGVPVALAGMARLKEVYLSGNRRLGGRIPTEIWQNLGGILGIGMSGLGLIGNIPESMGVYLENVTYLALDNNRLEGEVPDQFKLLERSAREINLANNMLRGRIPFSAAFIERMTTKLKLSGNTDLCLGGSGELLPAAAAPGGGSGFLKPCNQSEIPHPFLFTSGAEEITALPKIKLLLNFLVLLLSFRLI